MNIVNYMYKCSEHGDEVGEEPGSLEQGGDTGADHELELPSSRYMNITGREI